MPIRPPALDDRSYDDLVAELLARIPAHTPEWTNPRVGDPGRTLIELFAWLGDALLYRVNLIPERQRLAFLKLLGQPLRAARPARGLVTLSLRERKAAKAHAIRPGARFNGPLNFEARREFTALPVTAQAFCKKPIPRDQVPIELEALAEFHNEGNPVAGYATTALFAEGTPAWEGFDIVSGTSDRALWLALFAPPASSPEEQPATNLATATELGQSSSAGRQLLNVGFVPAPPSTDPLEPVTRRPPIPHVWEVTARTAQPDTSVEKAWQPEYVALERIEDTTAGLTQRGVVRLALPAGGVIHGPTNDVRLDPNAGVGDRPPRIDDEALASRLIGWLRLRPAPPTAMTTAEDTSFRTGEGSAALPSSSPAPSPSVREIESLRVVWAGINAVEIEQLESRANLVLGESNGTADQHFDLPVGSIETDTLLIHVVEAGQSLTWRRVDDLMTIDRDATAARDARVFQLDAEAGQIRFGDGVRGRVPPAGSRVIVRQMRSGGGTSGNLEPGSLKSVSALSVTDNGKDVGGEFLVHQPLKLTGGADPETLAEAEKRIPSRLRHRDRAVTGDDYRSLTKETPGVTVGRVELLPRFKPQQRHEAIPGVVTVMALPNRDLSPAPNPRADRPFLESIHAWLDARKPLATELYVIGCEYVPIAVSLAVTVREEEPIETTLQAVTQSLIQVLWPLSGGGFDRQQGWPLGRAVSNRELEVEVARVEGVSEVAGVNLFERNANSGAWQRIGDTRECKEQTLALQRWQLPELLAVTVVAGESAPLAIGSSGSLLDPGSPTNPFADPDHRPLTVPIVPTVC